jgi:transposase-like protein
MSVVDGPAMNSRGPAVRSRRVPTGTPSAASAAPNERKSTNGFVNLVSEVRFLPGALPDGLPVRNTARCHRRRPIRCAVGPGSLGRPTRVPPEHVSIAAEWDESKKMRVLVSRSPRGPRSGTDVGREVFARQGGARGDDVGGCALEDDPAAVVAGAGADVDDAVDVRHDRLVVLDDGDRLTGVDEPVEQAEQLLDVGEVEAGGRLVEDVDAALLGHVRGQLQPLPLARGQRRDGWNVSEVARRLGVSRQSVHSWIARYEQGLFSLADRSHPPGFCPRQNVPQTEALICELRREHPGWVPGESSTSSPERASTRFPPAQRSTRCLRRHHRRLSLQAVPRTLTVAPGDADVRVCLRAP